MKNDFSSVSHAKGQWIYHIEWCPKYRFNVFRKDSHKTDMEDILKKISSEYEMKIEELAVMPDHIHIVVQVPPSMSLSKAANLLKGRSSYEFLRKHENLRNRYKKGHMWSRGKFYRTVGDVDLDKTRWYVRYQIDIHQRTLAEYAA
jgi:putative transposase